MTPPFSKIREKIFYGWIMVFASLAVTSTVWGSRFSFGVFFKALENEFSLSRTATSSMYSLYMIFCGVFTVIGGWAFDRFGPRRVILAMGLISGASLLLASQTSSLWQLYFSYSLLFSIGTAPAFAVTVSAVSRWFNQKRGVALGAVGAGGGIGSIVVAPFAAYLVDSFGWRQAFLVMGLLVLFIVVSASRLMKNYPSDIGAFPDGVKPESIPAATSAGVPGTPTADFSLTQALHTRNFWIIGVAWFASAFSISLVMTHLVPYTTDIGISTVRAATIISVIGVFNIAARVAGGRIADIMGAKMPTIFSCLLRAVALLSLIWVRELWLFYLFAAAFGLSWGALGATVLTFTVSIFKGRSIGIIMGVLDTAFAAGSALGPLVGGLVFDATTSYNNSFLISAAIMVVAALLLTLAKEKLSSPTISNLS